MFLDNLTHTANFVKKDDSGAKDDYGTIIKTDVAVAVPCFMDSSIQKRFVHVKGEEKNVQMILFVGADHGVRVGDKLTNVVSGATELWGEQLIVAKIDPFTALGQDIHHFEISLV